MTLTMVYFLKLCKFADETTMEHAVFREEAEQLRDDLRNFVERATEWQMLFYTVEKLVVTEFGANNKWYIYNMNNATLKIVDKEGLGLPK